MLSGQISLNIPGVSKIMDKLDAQKAKFLSVPSNVRAALDRLGRIRVTVSKSGPVTVEFQNVSQVVEQNLKQTQLQWDTAAERFSQLDMLRKTQTAIVSLDTVTLASQLLTSVGYVVRAADTNISAVNKLAEKYLTAEQRTALNIATTGSDGIGGSALFLGAGLLGVFLIFRRR